MHEVLFDAGRRVRRNNQRRRRRAIDFACLYDDAELAYLAAGYISYAAGGSAPALTNIVRKSIDTYVAITARDKPSPLAQTTGADFYEARRAKKLTKVMRGSLERAGYYDSLTVRRRDAAIYGSSFALNYRIGPRVYHDKVYFWEVDVDFRDGLYGRPQTIYITRYVDAGKLKAQYPGNDDAIEKANKKDPDDMLPLGYDPECDQRVVRMAWHLPSFEGANDGRMCVAVSPKVLHWGKFTWDRFPLSKLDFQKPTMGYYGEGMAKQLEGPQFEINDIGIKLSEAHYMTPAMWLWVGDGSEIEADTLDNMPGGIIRSAQQPVPMTPQAAHPDLFSYYQSMRQLGQEESGVNQMAMTGHKPAGLNSGKALRMYKDSQSERFMPQNENVEQDCIDTAWQHYLLLEEAYAEDKKLRVPLKGSDGVELIPWDKIRMDVDSFVLTVRPANFFSTSPSARIEEATEFVNGPFGVTPEEGLDLLDYPDIDGIRNRRTAKERWIRACLDRIVDADDPDEKGVYFRPEPPMDLQLAFRLAQETYQDMRTKEGYSERAMAKVIEFGLDAVSEARKSQEQWAMLLRLPDEAAPPAQQQPPPGADPMQGEQMPPDPNMLPPGGE